MPFLRKYNTLLVTGTTAIRIPIIKRNVVDFALGADWTPAAGDVKVFVDGAAAANITNLPTATASGNTAFWEFILTAAELSCKQVLVMISDAATKAIEDQSFIVETYGNSSAMYAADVSLANLPANVTQLLGTAWVAPAVAGTPDVNAKQFGGQTVNAAGAVTMPGTVASTTNITSATGITVTTNSDKTGYTVAVGGLDSTGITAAAQNAIADAVLDRDMATGTDTGTDSGSPTVGAHRTVRQALRASRNKQAISAGTLTVYKEDDTTASWTAAITTTAGNPISAVDPTT